MSVVSGARGPVQLMGKVPQTVVFSSLIAGGFGGLGPPRGCPGSTIIIDTPFISVAPAA